LQIGLGLVVMAHKGKQPRMLPVQTPKSPQTFKHTPNIRTFKSPPNPILKRSFEAFAGH